MHASFMLVFLFLVLTSPCAAQDGPDQDEASASRGLVPLPDYSGELWQRAYLAGDWGGERADLAEQGLTVDLSLPQVFQGVVDGGQREGWRYGGKLTSLFTFDLDRAGALPGALVTLRTESRAGESVNGASGALLPVNDVSFFPLTDPADKDLPLVITELRYMQFLSRHLAVFLGKFTTLGGEANEFASGRGDTQFLSHAFLSASVSALINPYSTLGAGVVVMPSETMVFTSSVYSAADSSTSSGFDTLGDGWVWSTSLRDQHSWAGLPGGMMITGQYGFDSNFVDFEGQFLTPGGLQLPRQQDSWNIFWNGWQYLHTEEPADGPVNTTDGRTDLQGVGLFARAGVADRDTNPVEWTASGGMAGRGLIPGREDDSFGIGYAYSSIREAPFVTGLLIEDAARRVELYYTFSISPAVELTLDAQWVDSLLATSEPALLFGVRLPIRF